MQHYQFTLRSLAAILTALSVTACSQSDTATDTQAGQAQAPAAQADNADSSASEIKAKAGRYTLDRDHSSLHFRVQHLGLSNYVARFTEYDVELSLAPDDMAKSSVKVTIDPNSIAADYFSDYQQTHPDAEYESWTETLAKSDKFFNAGEYPQIIFESTSVTETGPNQMRVEGDLTLLGQTHPVTLVAKVSGSAQAHPMTGAPAIGFSAMGSFKRSTFGMTHLLSPELVSDKVSLYFEGEFQHAAAAQQQSQQAESDKSTQEPG